jgi:hypothetical protein
MDASCSPTPSVTHRLVMRGMHLAVYASLSLLPRVLASQALVVLDGPPRTTSRIGAFSFAVRVDSTFEREDREFRYSVVATNLGDTTAWLVPALCDALELRSTSRDTSTWYAANERTCLNTAPHRPVASRDSVTLDYVLQARQLRSYLPAGVFTVAIRLPQPRDPRGTSPMPTFPRRVIAGRVRWRP